VRAITCLLYNVIIISHFQCNNEPLMNSAGLWSWSRRLGLKTYQCLVWSCLHKNCRHLGLGHLHLMCKTNFWPNCEGHVKINYHRDDDRRWSLSRSWSFKVTNFDTKGKPYAISKWIIPKYILSRTAFQLSHSICQIIAFDKGMPLVNTLILHNLLEYLHQSYIARFIGPHFHHRHYESTLLWCSWL